MSQDSIQTTTRRGALHLLARASFAMTLPVVPLAFADDHADAEILRMASEINRHLDVYEPMNAAVTAAIEQWDEEVGFDLAQKGFEEWSLARRSAAFEAKNTDVWDYYHRHIVPLESAIVRHPAQTLAGLAVKAAVVRRFVAPEMWDANDQDADWNVLAIRRIADEAIAIAAAADGKA